MLSPRSAERGAALDDAPPYRSKSFETGPRLEAAPTQARAPDAVYALPFPVVIAPEALITGPVEAANVPHVADVAEPARKKPAAQPEVPATYRWHAVVPLVKPAELPQHEATADPLQLKRLAAAFKLCPTP